MQLAQTRGEAHIGQPMESTIKERKLEKQQRKEEQRLINKSKLSK